jgi:hypothetical protein
MAVGPLEALRDHDGGDLEKIPIAFDVRSGPK